MLREISFFHRCQTGSRESSKPANVAGKMNAVLIIQFKYQPDSLTVNVGDTVEWKMRTLFLTRSLP
jgi:plastocyanin